MLHVEQGLDGAHIRLSAMIAGERQVNLGQSLRLKSFETRSGLDAFGLGLGDWTLVSVEHRQLHADAQRPFVLALVPLIAGAEVHVGILFGHFESEGRLAGGVFSQRGKDIRSRV